MSGVLNTAAGTSCVGSLRSVNPCCAIPDTASTSAPTNLHTRLAQATLAEIEGQVQPLRQEAVGGAASKWLASIAGLLQVRHRYPAHLPSLAGVMPREEHDVQLCTGLSRAIVLTLPGDGPPFVEKLWE